MKKMMDIGDFKFFDRFEGLSEEQFRLALQMINAQFSGVYSLWSFLPPEDALAKRELCINYLVAWKLASMYPESAIGLSGTGGVPISFKKVGTISIKYRNLVTQEGSLLSMLTTNQYGIEALTMIQSAPEMFEVYA